MFSFEHVGCEVYMRHPSGAVKYTHSLEPRGQVEIRNTN